jgi:catechol 2,3-dioxygenase-like lactoylglutathione lyase family enzyme
MILSRGAASNQETRNPLASSLGGRQHAAMFDVPGRIKCGTVAAPDFDASLADWHGMLGLELVQEGRIPEALAASWAAPALAGARQALLRPASGNACFIRIIEQTNVKSYVPLRSYGWASFEITVRDVFALHAQLSDSGFRVIGPPRHVDGFTTFIPMQAIGRAGEVVYLNQVLQSMADLDLPVATSDIDQIFIAVLAAPDRAAAVRFHVDQLGFAEGDTYVIAYGVINDAFRLPADTKTAITMTRTGRTPATEVDQYPDGTTARVIPAGGLPPGNSMVSFACGNIDAIMAPCIGPVVRIDDPLYAGRRSACFRGTAGELVEMIEL